ncbi:hypothetical protein Misp01_71880 [Microtetraspora sp. NBRC 13810]|uniref:discoidin domain-containing protein n=1 Tax=Microtetraspora sp. NBRC 13810 TaxID=3030990 RepID=UPI0024A389C4|nr:discoidin domain-containing protein [Microtetraspora sp. NBRC 13810]GLW12060.1 hypothetical protein Misp01_71880 [Microtetraspora sp. NBRC 13810]
MKSRRLTLALAAVAAVAVAGPVVATAQSGEDPGPAVRTPAQAVGPIDQPEPAVKIGPAHGRGNGKQKVVPVADTERIQVVAGGDPGCPAAVQVGMRNQTKKDVYSDMTVEFDGPLTPSRPMLSSYLPAGYELGAKLLLTAPQQATPGDYSLKLDVAGEDLTVPVSVVALDDIENGGNLALRRPATASSTVLSGNYPACGAVDGDSTSDGWAGGNGWNDGTSRVWPDTFDVTLDGPHQLSRVDLYTLDTERYPAAKYGLRDWDVQVRAGGQWQTVAQVRGNVAGLVSSRFTPVTADAIRILTLGSNSGDYSRIIEVEAYE